jgi:hypothetical protein
MGAARDGDQDLLEQGARHHDLGHLEDHCATVPDDLGADLYQPVAQRGQRPLLYFLGQREGP